MTETNGWLGDLGLQQPWLTSTAFAKTELGSRPDEVDSAKIHNECEIPTTGCRPRAIAGGLSEQRTECTERSMPPANPGTPSWVERVEGLTVPTAPRSPQPELAPPIAEPVPVRTAPASASSTPIPSDSVPTRPIAASGGPQRGPGSRGEPACLDLRDLVRAPRLRPTRGWRGAAFAATRGRWNPGLSAAETERCQLIGRARSHLAGWHSITVSSMKGGIGKTTIAAGLGLTLAEHRGDRIVALDANPDAGTLADRLTGHCGMTVRELIDNIDSVRSWTDMAHYTSLAGRLQVLASEQDPAMSEAFSRAEYETVQRLLARFYNVIITDSGTGLVHSAMSGALDSTHTLVIAGAPTLDGASRAAKTLDWLVAHGYTELVERAVVALSCDRASRDVDRAAIVTYFQARCRAVVEIPADPHLAIGGVIELDALRGATRDGFLRLAAAVGEQFGWDHPRKDVL